MSLVKTIDEVSALCRDVLDSDSKPMSVRAIAKEVGVHYQHMLKFRDGDAGLSPENLDRLAGVLGIKVMCQVIRTDGKKADSQ